MAVFRSDATAEIGWGHVMRCLSLADALRALGWRTGLAASEAAFAMVGGRLSPDFESLSLREADLAGIGAMLARWPEGCDLLVIDDYRLGEEFEWTSRSWARRILVLEDIPGRAHDCDLLLDGTADRSAAEYRGFIPATAGVFSGPRYIPLRAEFSAAGADRSATDRILVTLGATDSVNAAVRILAELGGLEVDVVLGAGAPHLSDVRRTASALSPRAVVHTDIGGQALAGLMARSRLAIGAGGVSAWERCACGLPTLLVETADNQRDVIAALVARGAGRSLGAVSTLPTGSVRAAIDALIGDPALLDEMSASARALCDGKGALRVARLLTGVALPGGRVSLRPVAPADSPLMLDWQRRPETRRYALTPEVPTAEEHAAWFESRTQDPDALLLVIEQERRPVGVLRLDDEKAALRVSIYLDPDFFGRGIASAALAIAHHGWPDRRFSADVLAGNEPSHKLFRAARYQWQEGRYWRDPEKPMAKEGHSEGE